MIHLHTHSDFSVLDGLGKVSQIVKRAKELGAPAVAITDHGSISCLPALMQEANGAGIKPIIGCEFYLTDQIEPDKAEERFHLTVLAKSWAGVESLMERLTLANTQFYRRPRLQWEQALGFHDCIVSTACSFGVLARDNWEQMAQRFHAAYGPDFYLEVMPHVVEIKGVDRQRLCNERAIRFAKDSGVRLLATNDAHYVNEADHFTHNVLMAIQYNQQVADREKDDWGPVFYMRSLPEMVAAFKRHCHYMTDEQIKNAMVAPWEIEAKVNIEMPAFKVELPSIHENDDDAFYDKIMAGWMELLAGRVGAKRQAYGARLKYEVEVIKRLGFVRYFLIVDDVIRWARGRGIMVGPARGSAAGSLVCYLMGITQVDPIQHGLYFERFLNPERIDLPDIDVDFADSRRDEVFNYIREKYGHDKTANINTFGQLTIKSAFRDVCRAFGVSPIKTNALSKLIEDAESFESDPELAKFAAANPVIIQQAKALDGTIRQQGVHACGIVVSSTPLQGSSVIERRKGAEVVNWDKRECENFGLLKIDVLGLKTLSILTYARELIKRDHGIDIDYTKIPLNDPKSMEAFSKGQGVGVFQFENSGMQSLLRSLKASDFETITATTALFRPGSLNSGQTDRYVKIARGDEYETYVCPQIEPILKATKGVLVYQEQIMQIFVELGGFSWAHADKMRKIIGKKLGKDEFNKHRQDFLDGCKAKGIDLGVANDLFNSMVEFAAYSFNKSHAVAYTMISLWTMYVKTHFPVEFVAAYLTYTDDEDRVAELVREGQRMGVTLRNPDINISTDRYESFDGKVIAPLGIIKGVGPKAFEEILAKRSEGVFLSMKDFEARVARRLVNKGVVDKLVRAGAFESLGVRVADEEQRAKDYAELLPIFNDLPSLTFDRNPIDRDALAQFVRKFSHCGSLKHKAPMNPWFDGYKPPIMVINNPVKKEGAHLSSDGTRHLLKVARELGFKDSHFYYTSPIKCYFERATDAPNECLGKGLDLLREEIRIIKPKLIMVCANQALSMFADGKPSMTQLNGKVRYNKEFDAYVLFSVSPQYAYYQEDKAGSAFMSSMNTLRQIFS